MKKKVLLTSIITIALCLCLIAGSTFALFTSTATVNIAVHAGNVEVEAAIDSDLQTWSFDWVGTEGKFENGGKAEIVDGKLVINRMTPGDKIQFTIKVTNKSDVAIQYRLKGKSAPVEDVDKNLAEALKTTATVERVPYVMEDGALQFTGAWVRVDATNGQPGAISTITVTIEFPNGTADHDNPFRKSATAIAFTVEAVQANGLDANGDYILP